MTFKELLDCVNFDKVAQLIISPVVKASNEELAACCLWHTSFYSNDYHTLYLCSLLAIIEYQYIV